MERSLVMTAIGDDRPGLVELLARTVAAHGGNWLESRMARLGGKFAGILRVSVPEEAAAALLAAVGRLQAEGLTVVSKADAASRGTERSIRLHLVGTDHVGIVRDIAALLRQRQVNVEQLETEREAAPMSGEMLFRATALLRLPVAVTAGALRADLEELAEDLMVDIELSDAAGGD
jgi:glycine cleavage system regulatory protein